MNAFLVVLLIIATSLFCVALGILGAYCAVTGLLAAFNPSRPSMPLPALVAHESSASGD